MDEQQRLPVKEYGSAEVDETERERNRNEKSTVNRDKERIDRKISQQETESRSQQECSHL